MAESLLNPYREFIGQSTALKAVINELSRFARSDATILLEGETGTGKELAARAIHAASRRCDKPFVPVNCGAMPDSLVETEFFGYEKGAFTDARDRHRGLIATAEGGTLFLDEIETISSRGQTMLLRFLQDHAYRPVGGSRASLANVRIIAATNVGLLDLADRGTFRRDLLFRMEVLHVRLPSLRERLEDVPLLAQHFLRQFCAEHGRPEVTLSFSTMSWMLGYSWPGNVRELENLLLRAFLLVDGDLIDLPELLNSHGGPWQRDMQSGTANFAASKAAAIKEFERSYLSGLLVRSKGNLSLAARLAGKDRSAFKRLVRKNSLDPEAFRPVDPVLVGSPIAQGARRPRN